MPRTYAAKVFGFVYGVFFVGTYTRECLLDCLPFDRIRSNLHPGKLTVVMATFFGWRSIRAQDFRDGEELVDALRCSCAVFPLALPHRFRGEACFDGFFSEGSSAPVLSEDEAGVRSRVIRVKGVDDPSFPMSGATGVLGREPRALGASRPHPSVPRHA